MSSTSDQTSSLDVCLLRLDRPLREASRRLKLHHPFGAVVSERDVRDRFERLDDVNLQPISEDGCGRRDVTNVPKLVNDVVEDLTLAIGKH
jgi:hypothetical protein